MLSTWNQQTSTLPIISYSSFSHWQIIDHSAGNFLLSAALHSRSPVHVAVPPAMRYFSETIRTQPIYGLKVIILPLPPPPGATLMKCYKRLWHSGSSIMNLSHPWMALVVRPTYSTRLGLAHPRHIPSERTPNSKCQRICTGLDTPACLHAFTCYSTRL